jgi:hypothetical protein
MVRRTTAHAASTGHTKLRAGKGVHEVGKTIFRGCTPTAAAPRAVHYPNGIMRVAVSQQRFFPAELTGILTCRKPITSRSAENTMTRPAPAQGYEPHSYVIDRPAIEKWHDRQDEPTRESSTTITEDF